MDYYYIDLMTPIINTKVIFKVRNNTEKWIGKYNFV